jgi:methyl-accepting chemotaxis protein
MASIGGLVGLAFPLLASMLVEPKSTGAAVAFWLMCVLAGTGVGVACAVIAGRAGRALLRRVLDESRTRFGTQVDSTGDASALQAEVMRLIAESNALLGQARAANHDIKALTAQVLAATEHQASGAAQQAAAATQTSTTLEELAQTSKQIAENSRSVATAAERTLLSAEEGMRAVSDTVEGIGEIDASTQQASDRIIQLGERSRDIGHVIVMIDDIAEQTKILALNAAIEAARAGDAGRGFAVVAEEIRNLADSVTESTSEISRVVREIQTSAGSLVVSTERAKQKVEEGKLIASRTADALARIVSQVEETTDASKQISIATQQQRTASEQVVISMREIAGVSNSGAEASRQIQAAIGDLDRLADALAVRPAL